MHSKSDNIEIMMNDKADEVKDELFQSLPTKFQNGLETSMNVGDFIFDCIYLLYYKCHKINPNCRVSYIDSPDWIKNKKATINPINKNNNKCFQYSAALALYYKEIGKDSGRIIKLKPFIDKYNWERMNYQLKKDDWKKIEKNNRTNTLNILYAKNEKVYPG